MHKFILGIILLFFFSLGASTPYGDFVGKEVEVSAYKNSKTVIVAVNEESFDELLNALCAKDDEKILSLFMLGKAFEVENKTKIFVIRIDRRKGYAQIKILDGTRKGRYGFVLIEHLAEK